ncbi:hypothetical protein [Rosistilla oblonga]|uniref:hypothetical protein n=1 Tax=Rosistilla oblonga TaxID=2527990 RepID=UPI003A983AAE
MTVQPDGSVELAANTRILLDALPTDVVDGDHAVVEFESVSGTLRIGQPVGTGERGEFFDVESDKISFRRVVNSTSLYNPDGIVVDESPVSVTLRTEAIDASEGGSLAVSIVAQASRAKFAPADTSAREDGGQAVFANNYRLFPTANILTETDPRWPAGGPAWPGDDFENVATEHLVPPSAPSDSVNRTIQIETLDDVQTITGIRFEKAACYSYKYWGGGFRETALPWNIAPTVAFDTGGIRAYLSNNWQAPKWATMIRDDSGTNYFEDNTMRSPASNSQRLADVLAVYNQRTGTVTTGYVQISADPLVHGTVAYSESAPIGLDPSGEYELFNLFRDSTVEAGYRGNGAVVFATTPVVAVDNGLSAALDLQLLIWHMADSNRTLIRVTIPVGPAYRWTFQTVVDGMLSESASSFDLDPIFALPGVHNAAGAAGHTGSVKRNATQVVDGEFVGIQLPVDFDRGGTCSISW